MTRNPFGTAYGAAVAMSLALAACTPQPVPPATAAPAPPPLAAAVPPVTSSTSASQATMPERRAAEVEKRIAELHAKLRITSVQEPAWRPFAETMRENASAMRARLLSRSGNFTSLNALDNMRSYTDMARQHADNMQRLVTAFETLYQSLDEAQQRTADLLWRNQQMHRSRHRRA